MANKKNRVEKETRRLMEGVGDLVKRKGDRYKFKSKNKKQIKKVKKSCVHWIVRKGKEVPTVIRDPENPNNWLCTVCGKSFPIKPLDPVIDEDGKQLNPYKIEADHMLALVDQIQFWSVKLGGDADDTKMFITLKKLLPRFGKVSGRILKRIRRRDEFDNNRSKTDSMAQFNAYSGFNYR